MDQKSMVPDIDQLFAGGRFNIAEIHEHAVISRTLLVDQLAR